MYVLDTNVVSELRRVKSGKAAAPVAHWARMHSPAAMFLSVVSLHELEQGVLLIERRDEPQGRLLRRWLDEGVVPGFEGRILDITAAVARLAASYHVPDPAPFRDALIAATAAVHGMAVVTRNVRDFARFDVDLVDPWRG